MWRQFIFGPVAIIVSFKMAVCFICSRYVDKKK